MLKQPIFIERYPEYGNHIYFNVRELSRNYSPEAIVIIEQYLKKIDSKIKLANTILDWNPYAIHLFGKKRSIYDITDYNIFDSFNYSWHIFGNTYDELNNVDWCKLSEDSKMINILKKNKNMIIKSELLKIPDAINLIKKLYTFDELFDDKNCICCLINNPKCGEILEHYNKPFTGYLYNLIIITPYLLHLVYTLDYDNMRINNSKFAEELTARIFNPKRLLNICSTYDIEFDQLMEIYQ
jgi:hypothetical protein